MVSEIAKHAAAGEAANGRVRKVRKVRKVFSLIFWEKRKFGEVSLTAIHQIWEPNPIKTFRTFRTFRSAASEA